MFQTVKKKASSKNIKQSKLSFSKIMFSYFFNHCAMAFSQLSVICGQLLCNKLQLADVALNFFRVVPSDLCIGSFILGGGIWILNHLLESQCSVKHDRLLTRHHLLVNCVVEMCNLKYTIHTLGAWNTVSKSWHYFQCYPNIINIFKIKSMQNALPASKWLLAGRTSWLLMR